MSRSMKEVLSKKRVENFVGREQELAELSRFTRGDDPVVVYFHGLGGIGKSALCNVFIDHMKEELDFMVMIDCRVVEPSPQSILLEIANAIGIPADSITSLSKTLSTSEKPAVICFDTYEMFRMVDTWMRKEFIPSMPDNIRLYLFSRYPPLPAWLLDPEWQGIFHSVNLGPLDDDSAALVLQNSGIPVHRIERIVRFSGGNPLALKLAASTVLERPGIDLDTIASQTVVSELVKTHMSDVQDADTQALLEATSIVRRITQPLLESFFPEKNPVEIFDRLREFPFVEITLDGAMIHDSVRYSIASYLRAADPARHRDLQRKAWRFYSDEYAKSAGTNLWGSSADILFLIESPVVHDAFFPANAQPFSMESPKPEDVPSLRRIIERFEGSEGARHLYAWLDDSLGHFTVARDQTGGVAGFYMLINPSLVDARLLRRDPVTHALLDHLKADPMPPGQEAIFCRRWLDADVGNGMSDTIAACFLDVKGYYVAMKQSLRRLYCVHTDRQMYDEVFRNLLFRNLADYTRDIDGCLYYPELLDFGPDLFNGWATSLVASELGIGPERILDDNAGELVVDGKRIPLTPLELEVMRYFERNAGQVVRRQDLLKSVWGYEQFVGSNVVDAKISSLRKKLGVHASMIETVSGLGYRFRKNDLVK